MGSYKAGELSLDLTTTFTSINLRAIDSACTRLEKLSNALSLYTGIDVTWAKKLGNGLNILSQVDYKKINVSGIATKVNELSKALSSISSPIENIRWVNPLANGLLKLSQINLDSVNVGGITDKLTKLSSTISTVTVSTTLFDWMSALGRGLGSIARNVAKVDVDSINAKLTKLSSSVSAIATPTTSSDWLFSLGKGLGTLARNINKIDFEKAEQGFARLTTAITPFLEKVSASQVGLSALNGTLKQISNRKLSNLDYSSQNLNLENKNTKRTTSVLTVFKRVFSLATLRRMGYLVQSLVQYGTDYTETLNMWQVSMRDNLDTATEFVSKMSKAYSISSNTIMNAQAVFKNMLSNLGDLSEAVSYSLSESVTQMALDFSSLFNTTYEDAINKFQSVLSGQTRPIRSISGFDITEDTLYQIYQNLGGTKTKSALTVIEKRLLSIYAVYSQMGKSGAVGDLAKTLDNFANQARMVSENFNELKTQVGLFLQELLQSWGVLKNINAGLIFATEIVKTLVSYETPNFLDGLYESAEDANDSVDELTGKLLDFDKIRALNSTTETNSLALDQTILDALSSYSTILGTVKNDARELAEKWLVKLGLFKFDENGELVKNQETFDQIEAALKSIAQTAGVFITMGIIKKIIAATTALSAYQRTQSLLNVSLSTGLLLTFYSLNRLINDWDDLSTTAKIFNISLLAVGTAITVISAAYKINTAIAQKNTIAKTQNAISNGTVSSSLVILNKKTSESTILTQQQTRALQLQKVAAGALALGGIALLTTSLYSLMTSWDKMDSLERVSKIFYAISGAALTAAGAIGILKGISNPATIGLSIAAVTGLAVAIATAKKSLTVDTYAVGASDIDGGSLFVAGESGKTEMVYNGANGKSNVANVKQIKEATYQGQRQALNEWWTSARNDIPTFKGVSSTNLYEVVDSEARKRGRSFAKK